MVIEDHTNTIDNMSIKSIALLFGVITAATALTMLEDDKIETPYFPKPDSSKGWCQGYDYKKGEYIYTDYPVNIEHKPNKEKADQELQTLEISQTRTYHEIDADEAMDILDYLK